MAGAKKLRADGTIAVGDRVVCVLTGHQLKDRDTTVAYHGSSDERIDESLADRGITSVFTSVSFSNPPESIANELERIVEAVRRRRAGG